MSMLNFRGDRSDFEVSELDKDNEICFEISRDDVSQMFWLNIDQTKELIAFLEKQIKPRNENEIS